MKKIALILLFFCLNVSAQMKFELVYKVKSEGSMYDPTDQNIQSIKEYILKMEDELDELMYILRINGNESIWFLNDANSYSDAHMGKAFGGTSTYYFNKNENLFTEQREFLGNYFILQKNPENVQWELVDETKEIFGYTCKKAITKETKIINHQPKVFETIAWYCPDLKYAIGPLDFCGLEGLILELVNKKRKYYCTEINSNDKMAVSIIRKPTQGKMVSEEEYLSEMHRIQVENGFPDFKD